MAKKGETHLQKRIHRALKREFNCWFFKVHGGPFQLVGVPDLLGCVAGLFIALEVKMPKKGRVSEEQKEVIHDIKKKGRGYAKVVESPEEAVEFVRGVLAKESRLLAGIKAATKKSRRAVLKSSIHRSDLQAALRKDLHRLRRH